MKSLLHFVGAATPLGLLLLFPGCGADSTPHTPPSTAMTTGSGYSSAALSLGSATLSRDPAGKDFATLFTPSDHTLYVNVALSGPCLGARVRVVWTQVSESFLPDSILSDQVAVVDGDNNGIHVKGAYSRDWPIGTYKTDIYLNDRLERTLDWSVR